MEGAFKSAASDAVLEVSGLELRSMLEAVEATNLMRDAIVEDEASGVWRTRGALGSSTAIGESAILVAATEAHDITGQSLTFLKNRASTSKSK